MSANRKLIEDVQYHVRKLTYDHTDMRVWQEAGMARVEEVVAEELKEGRVNTNFVRDLSPEKKKDGEQ